MKFLFFVWGLGLGFSKGGVSGGVFWGGGEEI